jgi:hypothetical protein
MISIILNLLSLVLWPDIWCLLQKVPHGDENMYSETIEWNVVKMSFDLEYNSTLCFFVGLFFFFWSG